MSLDRVPSRSEVSGWSPEKLADFLKKSKLLGCDRIVLQNRITGDRFVNLSENDLQRFPKTYTPMISKLSADIRKQKKTEKRSFFGFGQSRQQQPETVTADGGGWGEDEFDDDEEDFDDYEEPCSDDDNSGGDYESPSEDQGPDHNHRQNQFQNQFQNQRQNQRQNHQNQDEDDDLDGDYEPPPSEPPDDFSHKLPSVPLGDSDYIDSHVTSRGPPPAPCPRPTMSSLSAPHNRTPNDSRRDASPNPRCGPKPPGKLPPQPPQICRKNKPGRDPSSNQSPIRGPHRNTVEKPLSQSWSRPQQDVPEPQTLTKPPILPPTSASVSRSNSGARPPPKRFDGRREQPPPDDDHKRNTFPLHNKGPRPGLPPVRHTDSLPPSFPSAAPHRQSSAGVPAPERASFHPPPSAAFNSNQDLDPVWYVGKVSRGQAEAALQQLGKDGAYVVRDSTRQSTGQPFTLMVFYQEKVFNIQIRLQDHSYLLGTGLKVQESFPSVCEIVSHYSQSPLLLIDAKNRGSGQQNQCLLSDPAGRYVHGQNWT